MGCYKDIEQQHNSTERFSLRENLASYRDARSVKKHHSVTNIP